MEVDASPRRADPGGEEAQEGNGRAHLLTPGHVTRTLRGIKAVKWALGVEAGA